MYAMLTSGLQMVPAVPTFHNWLTWSNLQMTTDDGQPLLFLII